MKNAVQYTVPKEKVVDMILSGKRPPHAPESLHTREVYVVKEDGADEKEIENKIKNTVYYFKGYETSVRFIDENEFEKTIKALPTAAELRRRLAGQNSIFDCASK